MASDFRRTHLRLTTTLFIAELLRNVDYEDADNTDEPDTP